MRSLTFSKPKNLSLPSSRTGPALCNNFSTGVRSCGGSSFLFLVEALLSNFEACESNCQPVPLGDDSTRLQSDRMTAQGLARPGYLLSLWSGTPVSQDPRCSSPTYRAGRFELVKEPRHGGRRGDQAVGASLDRRGRGAVGGMV